MKPADFLVFIGKRYYTRDSFTLEAAQLGISRRLAANQIPDDLIVGKSRIFVADEGGHTVDKPARVFGYFVPDALEFIGGTEGDKKRYVTLISKLILRDDTRILGTVEMEEERGCGRRKVGGLYIVVDKADSPLHLIQPSAKFLGNHFRGLMRLKPGQSAVFLESQTVSVMQETKCMTCGRKMRVPPSTLKKAERAARKIEQGIGSDWMLNCDGCKAGLKMLAEGAA
jgi:hypothetical protein